MEQHMGEKGLKLADQDRADHQVRSYYPLCFTLDLTSTPVRQGEALPDRVHEARKRGVQHPARRRHEAPPRAQRLGGAEGPSRARAPSRRGR